MAILTEWLTNIILFILLATILELLLPNSSMERYVKMVLGLLLLLMILTPLLSIFTKDMDSWLNAIPGQQQISNDDIEKSIENKKIDILLGQRAYISEQMAVQMKNQIEEELIEQFNVHVKEVVVSLEESADPNTNTEDAINEIKVFIAKHDPKEAEAAIEAVQVVTIDTNKEYVRAEPSFDDTPIQLLLAERWQIPKENIFIVWEGGEQ